MSSCTVVINFRLNVSWRTFITPSEINSGGFGPMRISWMPRLNKPSRIATAFCSNHDKTILTGSSFTGQSKALAKALAILIVDTELLHWPRSIYLGISVPGTTP